MSQTTADKERAALLDSLAQQRRHVLGTTQGLSDAGLRRPVLPSGWTCPGLVRHLAVDVERFWFRGVVAGEPIELDDETGWLTYDDVTAGDVFELYRREIELADAVLRDANLNAALARWPEYSQTAAPGWGRRGPGCLVADLEVRSPERNREGHHSV